MADVVPEAVNGVGARSALWGFEPYFFNPAEVRTALEEILFNDWQLPSK